MVTRSDDLYLFTSDHDDGVGGNDDYNNLWVGLWLRTLGHFTKEFFHALLNQVLKMN